MNKIEKRHEGVGRKPLKIIACSTFFVFSIFLSHLAFAAGGVPAITISVNDQGETIILSGGEILDISAGDGWRTFRLSSSVTIRAFIDPDTDKATVCVVTGTVEVTSEGQTVTVHQGECAEGPTLRPTWPELPDPPPDPPKSPSS
ncbi:MAG: hypothetical protein KAU41_10200 [Deltaproteobacteria bacterium]|jgi:hypothetical protein|nr:hypothetical protein [Deltaproteobacteria bacterium]